jgi:NAD(P)-dependent dehydrogenase (short-subunit alcohol dehydrogenase family)
MPYWHDKVAIVTGASGGLGFHLAEALVRRGANVAMAARTRETLEAAAAKLAGGPGSAVAIVADVTRDEDVARLFDETIRRFGKLDALFNNAGISVRQAITETTPDDFQKLLEVNLLATVRCTRAALPHLLTCHGHVVNIGSLAGKSAARWLGAYPASKFAVTAYTQQLRLELGDQGLHAMLVCPGPITRDDDRVRSPEELAKLPEAARRPGGGVKTSRLRPDVLAEKILAACERRRPELVIPAEARIIFTLMQISPRLGDWLVRKFSG